jgi:hypothetical protein
LTLALTVSVVASSERVAGAVITAPLPRNDTSVTNGRVTSIVRQGNDLYVGGEFSTVGPPTGRGVFIDDHSGALKAGSPSVNGTIFDAAPDGAGGVYIVGAFSSVNGISRTNSAHITASGSVDGWDPSPNNVIRQIELVGSQIVIAGDFTTIEGVPRTRLAMVDTAIGSPSAWRPDANASVNAIAVSPDKTRLFVGGSFTSLGGSVRKNIGSVSIATGAVENWVPTVNGAVNAIAVSPASTRVYVGGAFTTVGAVPRKKLGAVDYVSGLVDATWSADADAAVSTLAVSATDDVYVGGSFTTLKSKARPYVGAINTAGTLLPWNPTATGPVFQIVLDNGSAWLAGAFTSVRFVQRLFLAHVNLALGDPVSALDPKASGPIRTIVPLGNGTAFIGGDFTSVGVKARAYLARFNAATGALDPTFAPTLDGPVEALDLSDDGSTLYIGGQFQTVNGSTRHLAAALALPSGTVTSFDPNVTGFDVEAIDARGGKVALGGQFSKVNATPIANAARVDDVSGNADLTFVPNPNAAVRDVDILGDGSVILSGDFTKLGLLTSRQYVALIGPGGGIQPWNPKPTSLVYEGVVSPDGNTFYAALLGKGGLGNAVEAFTRTGEGTRLWRTEGDGDVQTIALSPDGHTVYAGGHFFRIFQTGTSNVIAYRNRAMALSASDGALLPWAPPLDFGGEGPYAILATADALYLGGEFTGIGPLSCQGLAFFPGSP